MLVAVSGGADSTALSILLAGAKVGPLALAHVRHGFRTEAAGEELAQVTNLSRRIAAPLHVLDLVPPASFRAGMKLPEAWAREHRYHELAALAERLDLPVLATGHHAGDRRETQLLHLLRGGGLRALAGMSERRRFGASARLWLWRPLLRHEPAELRALLRARGIDWIEDASNRDLRLARNRMRHELMPELDRRDDPLLRRADWLAELAQQALARIERACEELLPPPTTAPPHDLRLPLAPLRALPPILWREWLERAALRVLTAPPLRVRAPELRSVHEWLCASVRGGMRTIGGLGLRRARGALELFDVARDADEPRRDPLSVSSARRSSSRRPR